jgi:hypothetical protein
VSLTIRFVSLITRVERFSNPLVGHTMRSVRQ